MRVQRDTLLGLVFFGGLALIGWATVQLTRFSFEPRPTVEVYFPDARGLREGDPVFVLGKRVGQVQTVELEPGRVRVVVELQDQVVLHEDAQFEIRPSSLLGGVEVGVDPGTGERAEGPFTGSARLSAIEKLGEADLAGAVSAIKTFFGKLSEPENSVGALLNSRAPFEDLAATLQSTRAIVEAIQSGEGPLGMAVYDRQVAGDLAAAVADLRQVLGQVARGQGALPRLINDPEVGTDLAEAVADLREVARRTRAGEGALGKLTTDTDLADRLGDIVVALQSVAHKLDDPDAGLAGALLGDPSLRSSVGALADNLQVITGRIRSGEGLLGRLISDPRMADQVERLFAQVSGAVEDAREAAPVGTFLQVLLAPF